MAWNKVMELQVDDSILESTDSGFESESETNDAVWLTRRLCQAYWERMKIDNKVEWSKRYTDLPCERLCPVKRSISVATTGPGEGIMGITLDQRHLDSFKPEELSGAKSNHMVTEWTRRHYRAYGIGTSLYERDPHTPAYVGDPIADVYAVIARPNNSIISVADGVNWGKKSRLAARCGVAGSVQYLKQYLSTAASTHDVMHLLLKSFEFAQSCIIKSDATLTTLCTAVVVELEGIDQWGLCVLNVGDSLAFVYNSEDGVREITIGSHCEQRDMQCPGGSLGPVYGYNPDLRNLTFSFTKVSPGDVVFLTSDGVSDNFDPVVSHCGHCQGTMRPSLSADSLVELYHQTCASERRDNPVTLPSRTEQNYSPWDVPPVRLSKTLHDMTQVIQAESPADHLSASEVCANLLSHVIKCTNEKRTFLEQVSHDGQSLANGRMRRAKDGEIKRRVKQFPGKLDHATVVAFEVGDFPQEHLRLVSAGPEAHRSQGIVDRLQTTFRSLRRGNGYELSSNDEASYNELYNLLAPS